MLDKFLNDDSTEMRFVRTVAQGLLSVFIVAVPLVMGNLITDPTTASLEMGHKVDEIHAAVVPRGEGTD